MPKVAIIWQITFVCYGNNVYLCKMKMIVKMRYKILIIFVMMVFVGCTGSPKADQWPEWLIQADRDYKLAQGYDGKWQVRLAEMYYHKAYDALKETIEKVLRMEVDAKAKRNCEIYKTRDEAWQAFTHTSGYIINGSGWFDTWLFRKFNPNEYEAW